MTGGLEHGIVTYRHVLVPTCTLPDDNIMCIHSPHWFLSNLPLRTQVSEQQASVTSRRKLQTRSQNIQVSVEGKDIEVTLGTVKIYVACSNARC